MANSSQSHGLTARRTVTLTLIAALFALAPSASAQPTECNGLAVTILGTDGNDTIIGTAGDDVISLLAGDDIVESGAGNDTICDTTGTFTIDTGDGDDTVITGVSRRGFSNEVRTGAGNDSVAAFSEFELTTVHLGPGADSIEVFGTGQVVAYGEDGNDFLRSQNLRTGHSLYGGPGNDRIIGTGASGGEGDDFISLAGRFAGANGGSGDDRIVGSPSPDEIWGGPGNDVILGKAGNDKIEGQGGDDIILGGKGADTIKGGPGDDILKGGSQADRIKGGLGIDLVSGGSGGDSLTDADEATILGGKGNDFIYINGKAGQSKVKAGPGADRITAVGSNVQLHGDGGADHFDLEMHESTVYGDAGQDEVIFVATGPNLVFFLGSGDDIHTERPYAEHLGPIEVNGGPGNDHMIGTQFDDILRGNSGRDWFDGREGDDRLDGGKDNDSMAGGLGRDVVKGGGGTDYCLLGHFDLVDVDVDEPGIIGWEGPPDAGDAGDCEENWGVTGYWIYRGGPLFIYNSVNRAYEASKISKDLYGWNFDLQPEGVNTGPLLNPGDSPESRFR